jgi:hypothetical protein
MIMGKIRNMAKGQPGNNDVDNPSTRLEDDVNPGDTQSEPAMKWPQRPDGPWDISEISETDGFVDLGSMLLKPRAGVEVRVEVHPDSGQVARVAAICGDGAVNLQPFAAAKSAPIWPDLAKKIATQANEAGAKTRVIEGEYGEELVISDGSRWVGIDGPRWLLRCVYSGSAQEPGKNTALTQFVKDVVVVRGSHAVPPGDGLMITMPDQQGAVSAEANQSADANNVSDASHSDVAGPKSS